MYPHKLKSEEDVPHQLRSKDDVPHKQSGQSLSNTSREIISGPSAVFYPLPSMLSLTELLPERVQLSQIMMLSSELLPVSITQVSAFSNARVLTQKIIPGTIRIHDAALKLFSTNLWRSSNLGAKVSRATNFSVVYNNDHTQPAHGDGIEQAPAQLRVQAGPQGSHHQDGLYIDEKTCQPPVITNQSEVEAKPGEVPHQHKDGGDVSHQHVGEDDVPNQHMGEGI